MNAEYPHYRRNLVGIAGDWICFIVAMAFANYTSVIPSFINQLTDFAPLIGLVSTIATGAWLLPQLIAAHYLTNKERKKPFVIATALVGRPMYFFVALALFLTGGGYPGSILVLFFLAETVFTVSDGLGIVAWMDIMSKSIPSIRRGRLYSTGQIVGGLLAFAAGFLVRQILGPQGPAFPYNYALLFCLSSTFLCVALLFYSSVKEPRQEVQKERQPWRVYLPRLVALLRQDRHFRLINIVRLVAGLGGLAAPFYVIYATEILQIGNENIGLFVSAQVLGGVAASTAMGYLNERSGSKIVSIMTTSLGLSTPMLALLIHYCAPQGAPLTYVYALIFVLIGANVSGYMQGFTNLVLEIAPSDERPTYVGLYNTLAGTLMMVVPLLGGWLLQATSYPVLFGTAAIGMAISLALSFRLVEPRRE
jgi:MFS family permease